MIAALALAFFTVGLHPQIATDVSQAWIFHTRAAAPGQRAAKIAAFEATPVLGGKLLYVISPFDQVIALDPGAGKERWRYDPHIPNKEDYSEASARGVTVSGGKVFFGTLDARIIALDARGGKLLWQKFLRSGPIDGSYEVTSPPVVSKDLVIVGSSIADGGKAQADHGTVRAFDKRTGEMKWSWDPTPAGQTGAANAWAPLSIDVARDMVFLPTGSASPDFYGGLRPGNDLYADSVVALRASTGKFLWAFQVVHHDLWDYDVASRPELVEAEGKPAIGVLTKMGYYFLLDRITGQPLLPVEERAVPKSDIPGEQASPTQPVPLSGVFTSQQFKPRPGWCTTQSQKLRYEGIFTPPTREGTLIFPGNVGGANWGSGAYDAKDGLLIVAANRVATAVRLIPRAEFDEVGHGESGERWGQEYAPQSGAPFGMSRKTFLDPVGRPCNEKPWGALTAIDVATGKVRWETPLSVSLGGPLYVDGMIFFGGNIFETKLRAYSAEDGREIWETNLPYSAHSVPGTYIWKGKRYVVVCAGGHGKVDGSKLGDTVIAFRIK